MSAKFAFNDVKLRSLTEGHYWDTKLPAFGIRIGKRASTFFLKKDNRRLLIGHFPSMSLQDARQKAFLLKGTPIEPAEAAQASFTLIAAIDLYLSTQAKNIRPRSLYEAKRELLKLDALSTKPLRDITTHDVMRIIDTKPPISANNMFRHAHAFFRFCLRRRLIERSPLELLTIPTRPRTRARVLSDDDLKSVWEATEQPTPFNDIVRLCILTGQRRGELSHVQPEWVGHNTLTIPAASTKNNRQHLIPCGMLTIKFLKRCPFSFNSWSRSKAALDKASGIYDWTLHDLRRTFATRLAELSVAPHIIERLLNHASGQISGVVAIYNRATYMSEMLAAIEIWEAHLKTILEAA